MYDSLAGRPQPSPNRSPWANSVEVRPRWNCRCTGKAGTLAVTRCSACVADVPSTDIRDSMVLEPSSIPHLKPPSSPPPPIPTSSPPTSPTFPRTASAVSPLALKRLRAQSNVSRPLSASSIASSSSSSSSAGSGSCCHRLNSPAKSPYLASIESLGNGSEMGTSKDWFKCNGSQGSSDSGVDSCCSTSKTGRPPLYTPPHFTYMDRVVMETIETEQLYVRDLRSITEGYLCFWKEKPDFPLAEYLPDLFGNLEEICHFNDRFLKELEPCGMDPVQVARCFVRNNAGFSIYTDYCTNYPKTVSLLTELMGKEETARLFRERQNALQQSLPLGSYLLKPVQRILKYHLLLQNIVKQSVKNVAGYEDMEDALAAMTGIAQHINDMKRKHEHAVRVQEIQSLLHGWQGEDLTTFGELCAEGSFRVAGAKALRHIFLFDKVILITKKKEEGVLGYKAHIKCSNLMLIESVPGEPLCFHVIPFDNPRMQYTLLARNMEQKREWTLSIKSVILENYNAVIPSHARQLVMQLGTPTNQDSARLDRSISKRQHSAPEYLERRKQDRRKSEVGLRTRLRRSRNKSDTSSADSSLQIQQAMQSERDMKCLDHRRQSEPLPLPHTLIATPTPSQLGSMDLSNAEEVDALEKIVGQLQDREFEKVLKSQQHRIQNEVENCADVSDLQSETTDDCDIDGIYETLINVKLMLAKDGNEDPDADYVTLVCPTSEEDPRRSRRPLRLSESLNILPPPTQPSVWLKQQDPHLATPSKKAGSLPRSFQINLDGKVDDGFKDARNAVERPFTIASDQPNPILYEGRYSQPLQMRKRQCVDESTSEIGSTPGASQDRIDVHPEYRIYRSAVSSKIFKNAISSVTNRLAYITTKPGEESKIMQWERKASKVVQLLARHCSKTIKKQLKNSSFSPNCKVNPSSQQGISNVGARLAGEPAFSRCEAVRPKAAALLGITNTSHLTLLPFTSTPNSSFLAPPPSPYIRTPQDCTSSTESIDSYYERSFEAMDGPNSSENEQEPSFSDEERDSGVVENKSADSVPTDSNGNGESLPMDKENSTDFTNIGDEEVFKRTKSIRERQMELQNWRLRQNNEMSEVCQTVASTAAKDTTGFRGGWVKHVVGKLQAAETTYKTES